MIKILLPNANKGRNKASFAPFLRFKNFFKAIEVDFRTYGKTDFVFLGNEDFQNRKLSVDDSINYGLDQIAKQKAKTYLIDSSDSTSLFGLYDIVKNSNAVLVKNQITDKKTYQIEAPFGKWFFEKQNIENEPLFRCNLTLPIKERIELSGYNLGYHSPSYDHFVDSLLPKDIDVCAIYQHEHNENYDWGCRDDIYYTKHRSKPFEILSNLDYKVETGKKPYEDYVEVLQRSKVALSPFGMGEICFRDFELMKFGVVMIKPKMNNVITKPNPYIPWETYIPVKPDWSDLEEVLQEVLGNWDKYKHISENFRNQYRRSYLIANFIENWHSILLKNNNIST